MLILKAEHVLQLAPRCTAVWAAAIIEAMRTRDITTRERAAMYLAQITHESQGLTRFEENMNYSAKRLVEVFPRKFPRLELALLYANAPQKIANRVYGGREDLGNRDEASGDGWRFRGRGPMHLTGRDNYQRAGDAIGHDLIQYADDAATPYVGSQVAAWFWHSRGLNELADTGDFRAVTKRINTAMQEYERREALLFKARRILAA